MYRRLFVYIAAAIIKRREKLQLHFRPVSSQLSLAEVDYRLCLLEKTAPGQDIAKARVAADFEARSTHQFHMPPPTGPVDHGMFLCAAV